VGRVKKEFDAVFFTITSNVFYVSDESLVRRSCDACSFNSTTNIFNSFFELLKSNWVEYVPSLIIILLEEVDIGISDSKTVNDSSV
jgi:hypothetical protein